MSLLPIIAALIGVFCFTAGGAMALSFGSFFGLAMCVIGAACMIIALKEIDHEWD